MHIKYNMFAHKVTDKMISKNNERNRSPRSLNQYFIRNEDLDFTYRRLNFIFNAIPIGETREPYIYINIYIYIYLIYILYCRCLGTRGEALNQNRRILSLFVFTKGIKLGIYDKSSILCLQRSNKLHSNKPQLCSWVYC